MDWLKQLHAASVCLAAAVSTAGCSAPQPTTSPSVPVEAAPDPDDAVLVKAIEAYAVFNAALDGYLAGSSKLDALRPMTTDSFYAKLESEEGENATRVTGASSFDNVELIEDPPGPPEGADLAISLCRDVSQTSVVSESGDPPEAELKRVPLVVYMTRHSSITQSFLISEVDSWPAPGYCEH